MTTPSGAELRARWPAERVSLDLVWPMFGPQLDGLNPEYLVAFKYPSAEAAETYCTANRVHHGHRSWYVVTDGGVFGVVDYSADIERRRRHDG